MVYKMNTVQQKRNSRERLSRKDWIDAASQEFAVGGPAAVTVEMLARKMGVTKGSFYWHFKDRDELLTSVLAQWRDDATMSIIENIERQGGPHRQRLKILADVVLQEVEPLELGGRLELAFRNWARQDELANNAVAAVDHLRLQYLTRHFAGLGLPHGRAVVHAHLYYSNMLGQLLNAGFTSKKEANVIRRRVIEHLLDDAEAEGAAHSAINE